MTYKLIKNIYTNQVDSVRFTNSEKNIVLCIPFDEANTDYQEYLEWAKTNTAEEAD
tara:strand:- start:388 stop:555 length:168 start_codon:yes stop_codon:yes gene_type:complete